jgi:hypothetical protein
MEGGVLPKPRTQAPVPFSPAQVRMGFSFEMLSKLTTRKLPLEKHYFSHEISEDTAQKSLY